MIQPYSYDMRVILFCSFVKEKPLHNGGIFHFFIRLPESIGIVSIILDYYTKKIGVPSVKKVPQQCIQDRN